MHRIRTYQIAESLMNFLRVTEENRMLNKMFSKDYNEESICHKIHWDSVSTNRAIISYVSDNNERNFFWTLIRDWSKRGDIANPKRVLEGLYRAESKGVELKHHFEFRLSCVIHTSREDKEECWKELEDKFELSPWSKAYGIYSSFEGSYLTVTFVAKSGFNKSVHRDYYKNRLKDE